MASAATRTQRGREFESQTRTSALCFLFCADTDTRDPRVSELCVRARALRQSADLAPLSVAARVGILVRLDAGFLLTFPLGPLTITDRSLPLFI